MPPQSTIDGISIDSRRTDKEKHADVRARATATATSASRCFCSSMVGRLRSICRKLLPMNVNVLHGNDTGADADANFDFDISMSPRNAETESVSTAAAAAGYGHQQQEHPELEDLYLIDLLTNQRIPANGKPMPIENDFFKGHLLFMSRTSDADSKTPPHHTGGTRLNDTRSNYLRPRQRRFEIQVQCQFKKIPPSQLFFHCQLRQPIQIGTVQRAFVSAALKFVKRKNKGAFVYNVPGKTPTKEQLARGNYEKPHLTFVVDKIFDRITVTKPGEDLPMLGTEIYEDPKLVKRRAKGEHTVHFNTTDTFTFALWSAYIDFTQWQCMNLPAIRPFSLSTINKDQDFSMHLYYLKNNHRSDNNDTDCDTEDSVSDTDVRHFECNQTRILSMELNNAKYCRPSEARKRLKRKDMHTAAEFESGTDTDTDIDMDEASRHILQEGSLTKEQYLDVNPNDLKVDIDLGSARGGLRFVLLVWIVLFCASWKEYGSIILTLDRILEQYYEMS